MATFNAVNGTSSVRFDTFSIASLLMGATLDQTATLFRRGPDADHYTSFAGSGFVYSGGLFNAGTIDSISSVAGGQTQFSITGLSLPVAQFRNFAGAGNSQGFLAAIFAGNDTLIGTSLADHLRGYAGDDMISNNPGSADNDTLDGGGGADSMDGADGDDLYIVDHGSDAITESSGIDSVKSSVSYSLTAGLEQLFLTGKGALDGSGNDLANQIVGSLGANQLFGLDGNDSLDGSGGNDTLGGGGGNDTMTGGIGADAMDGGAGDDFYLVDNLKDSIADSGGIDSIQSSISVVLGTGIEHLFLTGNGALTGKGNDLANQLIAGIGANKLSGLAANDMLDGNAGNDTLDGGTGNDTMLGGAGNDIYFADSKSDQVVESIGGKAGGVDTVFSSADITLGNNIENLTLTGSADIFASGNSLGNAIVSKNTPSAGNTLNGFDGNDTISGSIGNDVISGGAGADVMIGGAGSDTYGVESPADKVVETLAGKAGGTDTVVYGGATGYTLGANVESLSIVSSIGATFGIGNNLDNTIVGNSDANLLDGKAGADTILGQDGNDTYVVDNALDVVDEASGLTKGGLDTVRSSIDFNLTANGSTVLGDFENLTLLGKALIGTGNGLGNQITGNAGKNTLIGLDGNDTLDGGAGNDTLRGGNGNDLYIVDSKLDVIDEAGNDFGDLITSSKVSLDISAIAGIEDIQLTGLLALNATGNAMTNAITGNAAGNKLSGLGGMDFIVGGNGNDTLDGGSDFDYLAGGTGNDTYIVNGLHLGQLFGDAVDELIGGGIDTVISSEDAFLDATAGDVENLVLASGSAAIMGSGNILSNKLTGNENANVLNDGQGDDTISGGGGDDTINGGAGNDSIDGGLGNDNLRGHANDDTINVAAGNDIVAYDSPLDGHDVIIGFDGNAAGGQDKLDLTVLFDSIVLPSDQRAARVLILDNGATVDVRVNFDGDLSNGYELTVATLQTPDAVTVEQDVILG